MAGSNPDFNAAEFRDGIRLAMDMGAPVLEGERATFYFASTLVYNANPVDESNVPFDPTAVPVTSTPTPPKQVTCAVEYFDAAGRPTDFGTIVPSRAEITLMDEDYAKVVDFTYVALRGERFDYSHTEYPSALFDVGIYTIHVTAVNAR